MDVISLYTSIPHSDGLLALKHFLSTDSRTLPVTTLLRLAELVLTLNSFQFHNQHYQQTSGVAMGTRMGPSYACLFLGHLEEQILQQYTNVLPVLYRRFIDDCFGVATCSKDDLLLYINFVSNFHPSINFTFHISDHSLSFLDLDISISPDSTSISTSVHYKPTDSHSYLLFSSSHPHSTKCAIPFSQFLRLRRICSSDSDFQSQARAMLSFFLQRGYPESLCHEALTKAASIPRAHSLLPATTTNTSDRPILTLIYHPHNIQVKNILLKHYHILQSDPSLKDTFSLPPLVAYQRDTNLRDHLVSSRVRSTYSSTPGTTCCDQRRCACCPHISDSTSFTGPKGRFSALSPFSCLSTNLVYIIQCTLCHQLYVGETYRTLKERLSEHLSAIRHPAIPSPVGAHFRLPFHSVQHLKISGIWQNHSDRSFRQFMESRIITTLGTSHPLGMNLRL